MSTPNVNHAYPLYVLLHFGLKKTTWLYTYQYEHETVYYRTNGTTQKVQENDERPAREHWAMHCFCFQVKAFGWSYNRIGGLLSLFTG